LRQRLIAREPRPIREWELYKLRAVPLDPGRTVAELFATFDPEPLAAASIGQAHAAIDSVDRSGPRRYPVDSMDG
jgi:hypothetical protein